MEFLIFNIDSVRAFRNCILCEAWVLYSVPLCKSCRKYLYRNFRDSINKIIFIKEIKVVYLWNWQNDNHEFIQKIILSLKDGANFKLYLLFKRWLIIKLLKNNITPPQKEKHFLIAIPSADRSHPQALLRIFNMSKRELKEITVSKVVKVTQKLKSAKDRKAIRFKLHEKIKPYYYDFKAILLDDTLVTGSSAEAVKNLIFPVQIEYIAVWSYKASKNATFLNQDCFDLKNE